MRREIKHGRHNQKTHGKRGRAGKAGKAAFDASRAAGSSLADARAAGRAASAAERAKMKAEAAEARVAKLRSQADIKRRAANSGQVTEAQKRRLLESADRLEARARGEKVGPRTKAKPEGAPIKGEATPVLKFDSPEEADAFMRDRMNVPIRWSERDALQYYQEGGDMYMNSILRFNRDISDGDIDLDAKIDKIDSAMGQSRTKDNVEVYRGMSFSPNDKNWAKLDEQLQVGRVFADQGFLSTTVDRRVAQEFADVYGARVLMNIRVPAGTPAVYMNSHITGTTFESERELLVNRDTPMRIIGRRTNADGIIEVDAEIIPQ